MFVAFSVSYLTPAFVVLVLGNTLTSVVFVVELTDTRAWKQTN
jgi:hypothetical protein